MLDNPKSVDERLAFLSTYKLQYLTFFFQDHVVAKRELTLKYIFYRVFRPILKFNYRIFKLFHKETPWTSQMSIIFFKKFLKPDMIGLEYGSGYSTLSFSKKVNHLTSIEHNETWYNKIQERINKDGINNVEYIFVPDEDSEDSEVPEFYRDYNISPDDFRYKRGFKNYFSYCRKFPDEHFDFILIDGRARVECILNCIPKLTKQGMLILDQSERQEYQFVYEFLKSWDRATTSTGLTNTTFFIKP